MAPHEYQMVSDVDLAKLQATLNDLGSKGWRVVGMAMHGQIVRVILERPLPVESK